MFILLASLLYAKEPLLTTKQEAYPNLVKLIQEWIGQLDSSTAKNIAFNNLVRLGHIAHPYLLNTLISSPHALRKKRVIEILRQAKNQACVPILLKCLENNQEDPRVRGEAAAALGMFPIPEVLATLQKYAFHGDVRIHQAASHSLCQQTMHTAIPCLISLLKHWNVNIARKAYLRLLEITHRDKAPLDFEAWQQWWAEYQDIFEEPN
jgi:HEAT repeat protein